MTAVNPGPASSASSTDQLATQGYVASQILANAPTRGSVQVASASRYRVALLGDSITSFSTQYQNPPLTAGSIVVNNGVGTINMGGNVQVFAGNYFLLVNPGDTNFTHPDNGRIFQAITGATGQAASNSITYSSQALNGDYSNPWGGVQWQVNQFAYSMDSGYFAWLNNFSRGQFTIVANYGGVGVTSVQTLAQMPKVLSGPRFDVCHVSVGTNDMQVVTTAAQAQAAAIAIAANITQIVNQLLAYGASVVLNMPPPMGTAISNAAIKTPGMMQLRTLLYKLAWSNSNIAVLDIFRECVNGTVSANGGGFVTNGSTDGTHPSAFILCQIARNQAVTSIQKFFPILDNSPVTILDDNINFAQSGIGFPNTVQNAGMVGTGGTLAGGATGSAANNWTLTNIGATTVGTGGFTRSQSAVAANWGFAQRVQCTMSAANQGFSLTSPNNAAAITTGWYRVGIQVFVRSNTSGIATLSGVWGLGNQIQFNALGAAANQYNLLTGDILYLTSGPLFLSGTPLNNNMILTLNSIGAGSVDFEFSAPFIRQIDSPYA